MSLTLLTGIDYLHLVTALLHRVRDEDPTAGVWEAGDLQWWWRKPRTSDEIGQLFWLDAGGDPVAAVILTDWGDSWGCDPIVLPSRSSDLPAVWARAVARIEELDLGAVDMLVRDDDAELAALAEAAGFAPSGDHGMANWMDAAARPPVAPLADGYRLRDRVGRDGTPHHMIPRNGLDVAERLAQTSLYRPDLDLCIEAADGEVAAYAMFWLDPETGVGLVEPMRTEEAHQRRGLARHLLTAGLDRLAARGAARLKISYEADNHAARDLYLGTGFVPVAPDTNYARRQV